MKFLPLNKALGLCWKQGERGATCKRTGPLLEAGRERGNLQADWASLGSREREGQLAGRLGLSWKQGEGGTISLINLMWYGSNPISYPISPFFMLANQLIAYTKCPCFIALIKSQSITGITISISNLF